MRKTYIDNIKWITVVLVVIYHVIYIFNGVTTYGVIGPFKGAYDKIGEAYAFIMKYAEQNGYKISGLARECYIDGIWNKESEEDWLTEIQLPVE